MSTIDLKNAWEEAVQRAMLARRSDSELTGSELESAVGLPLRTDLKAGAVVTSAPTRAGCAGTLIPTYVFTIDIC